MASTLFFQGRAIATPGSFIEIDASALEPVGFESTGIIAIIGTAEGGTPIGGRLNNVFDPVILEPEDVIRIRRPEQSRQTFRSGELREAIDMAFGPSRDPVIPNGATEVVALKLNPATQSTFTLANAYGDVMSLETEDYGAFTSTVSTQISPASAPNAATAKMVRVGFEATEELGDSVGGSGALSLEYRTRGTAALSTGWDTMVANLDQAGVMTAFGTRTEVGIVGLEVTAWTGSFKAESAADVNNAGTVVTVYGVNVATGADASESIVLSATLTVQTDTIWSSVYGVTSDKVAVTSNITISEVGGGGGTVDIPVGGLDGGVYKADAMFVANEQIEVEPDAGAAGKVIHLFGAGAQGQFISEAITLPATGVKALSVNTYSRIDAIEMDALIAGPDTVIFRANAIKTDINVEKTLRKLYDHLDARSATVDVAGTSTDIGFIPTLLIGAESASPALIDEAQNIDIHNSVPGTPSAATFTAMVQGILEFYNLRSSLVEATESARTLEVETVTVTMPMVAADTFSATVTTPFGAFASRTYVVPAGTYDKADTAAALAAIVNATAGINNIVTASASGDVVSFTSKFGFGITTATAKTGTVAFGATATATPGVGARVAPTDMGVPVFFSGGSEGTASQDDWDYAFTLLRRLRVNTIVPMTGDPLIHAQLEAHCQYMSTLGKSERDGLVGLQSTSAGVPQFETLSGFPILPGKNDIKQQIIDLNSRHLRACAQNIDRFNSAGDRETFPPWYQAVIGAGMQAGAPLAEPLTFKYANVLRVEQDTVNKSWNPDDDSDEMIQSGLWFMKNVPGTGRRVVRNTTTYLISNNLAFTEASVNQAVNFVSYELRREMEKVVGKKGNAASLKLAQGLAQAKLNGFIDVGVLVSWRALSLELKFDILEISVEVAPVLPINFVKTVLHLVAVPQSLAA